MDNCSVICLDIIMRDLTRINVALDNHIAWEYFIKVIL